MTDLHDDLNPTETEEWLDALGAVIEHEGSDRAHYLLKSLSDKAARLTQKLPISAVTTPYRNTISPQDEDRMPGDMFMERQIRGIIRWNALITVMRANQDNSDLGGHISSFASSATLYDVGFNYFFRGPTENHGGDLILFQGHVSPGIYARSYLEGRISEAVSYTHLRAHET